MQYLHGKLIIGKPEYAVSWSFLWQFIDGVLYVCCMYVIQDLAR